ncbi:hypothetical protein [Dyadobacter sp. CY356]|uniref:hypothetical protein n=1 Tax=Dyadobacter sp. CY356 TaxID=2906442 RepID=UPI001F393A5C|nr:hypothetical protein [Dyadobacter sp. CY356]MCF0058133.1 hypothetical protein [Dyadobacter sp. CY356]
MKDSTQGGQRWTIDGVPIIRIGFTIVNGQLLQSLRQLFNRRGFGNSNDGKWRLK